MILNYTHIPDFGMVPDKFKPLFFLKQEIFQSFLLINPPQI